MGSLRALTVGLALLLSSSLSAQPVDQNFSPSAIGNASFTVSVEPISPLPVRPPVDAAKRALGQQLFFDTRLSGDGQSSCASCHQLPPIDPAMEPAAPPVGLNSEGQHKRDTPLLYNIGYLYWLDWDGRYSNLERLIEDAITDVDKLNSRWPEVVAKLTGSYDPVANRLYGSDLNQAVVEDALATFLRSLNTPNSAFDRYLLGDQAALTERQQQGYALFKQVGCSSCHNGRNIGGNFFEQLYVYRRNAGSRVAADLILKDLGRYYVTGEEPDRNTFRVSPLRNVAVSAPFFHNGSAATLEAAVILMAEHQLGLELRADQTALLVDFLHSLTGEHAGVSGASSDNRTRGTGVEP